MASKLYIAKAPQYSSFDVHKANLDMSKNDKGGFLQLLKAKCRELARSDSGLLVSPTTEALKSCYSANPQLSVWIVSKAGYIKNPKTTKVLNQLNMRLKQKDVLSHATLQACYHFTLVARLAPKWNRVINWLIQGSEFLTEGRGQGIGLQVGLTNNDITLSLSVHKLSLSLMKVEDLLTTPALMNSFKKEPHCVIHEGSIYNNRCLLLPNFTNGFIYSASHFLPPGEEFQTYDQVRLHWKKQHGIILPEREDLFYQIFFKGNPRKFFSYPGSCVYKSKPIQYSSKDADIVATSFITDVHTRLPTICGEQVRYCNRALTPCASLQQPTTSKGLSHANLKKLPVAGNQRQGYVPLTQHIQPKPKPSQVVPSTLTTTTIEKQSINVGGARVVPIFKAKSTTPQLTHNTSASQPIPRPPIIPRFKPTSSTSQILGKRPLATLSTKDTKSMNPKRPCTETVAKQAGRNKQILVTESTSTQQTLPAQSTPKPSLSCSHSSHNQTVPDMSASMSSHLNTDDCDFVDTSFSTSTMSKGKATVNKKVGKPQSKLQGTKKTTATTGLTEHSITGIGTELMKKITKAKAAVLKKWLGENGVKCRSKEKKDDLVKMVAQHIVTTGKAFEPVS